MTQFKKFRVIGQKPFLITGNDCKLQLRTESAFKHGKDAFSEKSGPADKPYNILHGTHQFL